MRNDRKNIIVEKTFDLALETIVLTKKINDSRNFFLANQLFKSGTSIGANVREAQNAESLKDFIHKMKISAKEADETEYWLELLLKSGINVSETLSKCREIQKILNKIISSSKLKRKIESSISEKVSDPE